MFEEIDGAEKGDLHMNWRVAVALLAALLLLAGCGKSAQDKAADSLVNSLLDGMGIEVGDDGQSVTFKGEDGSETTMSALGEGTIPDGFVLPVLPGMKADT